MTCSQKISNHKGVKIPNHEINKKKVLLVYLGRKGGGAHYTYELSKLLNNTDYTLNLFLSKNNERLNDYGSLGLNVEPFKTFGSLMSLVLMPFTLLTMFYKILKERPDVVWITMYNPLSAGLIVLLKIVGFKKIVYTLHGRNFGKRSLKENIMKISEDLCISIADEIIVLTDFYKTYVKETFGKDSHIVLHPIIEKYKHVDFENEKLPIPSGEYFLVLGRIGEAYKNIGGVLASFSKYKAQAGNKRLVLAGRLDNEAEISQMITDYKLEGEVIMVNKWLSDGEFAKLMYDSHALILAYRHPTPSGVLTSYLPFNKPILCSKEAGLYDYIDGRVAVFFSSKDTDELAKAMLQLDNGKVYARMCGAVQTVQKEMNEKIKNQLINVF